MGVPNEDTHMSDRESSGEIFGIPYNFESPTLTKFIKSHWQPGEGMLVSKPFGIGYSLNLANWKSWVVILVAIGMVLLERREETKAETVEDEQEPVEVIIDD